MTWWRRRRVRQFGKRVSSAALSAASDAHLVAVELVLVFAALLTYRFDALGGSKLPLTFASAAPLIALVVLIDQRIRARRSKTVTRKPAALDLHAAVRAASSMGEAYERLVLSIEDRMQTQPVCLLLRAEATGEFFCCAASKSGRLKQDELSEIRFAPDAFVVRRLSRLGEPWNITPEDFSTWMSAMQTLSASSVERRAKECDTLRQMETSLLVRISSRDEMVGMLSLAIRPGKPFSNEEHDLLRAIAAQLALIVDNARLLERVLKHKKVEQELALAADVQRNLLPEAPPKVPGIVAASFCQPAREVGGDYFDFIVTDDGRLSVALGDVSGKGFPAALLMSALHAFVRAQFMGSLTSGALPSDMVQALNRLLLSTVSSSQFVTFFIASIQPGFGHFQYVNAGHNPPLLFRRGIEKANMIVPLSSGGPVLGLLPKATYEAGTIETCAGDILVAYTDGLPESINIAGDEFGEEQLVQAVFETREWTAQAVIETLKSRIQTWSFGAPQHDDITAVVIKFGD
jgi:phosphoserine phosphatase RsbU/P